MKRTIGFDRLGPYRCHRLLLLAMLLFAAHILCAQAPERIYGKNKVLKPNAYYLEQIDLWKAVVDRDPHNADAWFNYYRASRNAHILGEEDNSEQSKGLTRFQRLKKIVEDMALQVPNSYEFNFVKWLNGNNDPAQFPYLEKAHELCPACPEPLMSQIYYYEVQGDYEKRNQCIQAYYKLGDYSPGLLNYGYNLLVGLEKDAIVFTEGDKDTDAILILTQGRQFRPDVRMLNVNLLLGKDYRTRVFEELGIPPLDFDPLKSNASFAKYQQTLVQQVAQNRLGRPVYLAVTVSEAFGDSVRKDLHLTGLAQLYRTGPGDYLATLEENVVEHYLLDYLSAYFVVGDISEGNVRSMNGNYLLPFAALSRYYLGRGERSRAAYYREWAYKVAEGAGRLAEFETYFPK